jgi:hypothetical protein
LVIRQKAIVMQKHLLEHLFTLILFLTCGPVMFGQLVINELDSDTPGVDDREFIELRSSDPNFPLDGYLVVFFNGSASGGNRSYLTIELDGYKTDVNGLFLIGSHGVSPVPQYLLPENTIQNGADGVGIYQANPEDFPEGTLATDQNLIDALVYDTNDADVPDLMQLLNVPEQINEAMNGQKDTESIQLDNDGNYFVGPPTPRQLNDGSGIVLNGITLTVPDAFQDEGASFMISLHTEEPVDEEQIFEFSLENGTFDQTDFTGNTFVSIPAGMNAGSTTIQLVDDELDEGDEEMVIRLLDFPETFLALNDNLVVRVVDNDFVMAPWGSPIHPTFGLVQGTEPSDYYQSLTGKAGADLRLAIRELIANSPVVRAQTYSDIIDILKKADQNPANSNEVWLVYSEKGKPKLDFQTGSDNTGKWNREHTFPRSRGGFFSIEADEEADGPDVFWQTNADSLRHGNSDGHGLRAVDGIENSARGNQHYGQYNGPGGNLGSFKGDVARSVLYMELRYNGLEVVDGFPEVQGQLGDLTTLLDWHRSDPPDDYEMNRNNVVYGWQKNRNPLIDLPELVEYIWGSKAGESWTGAVQTQETGSSNIRIFPNPATNRIVLDGLNGPAEIRLFSNAVLLQEIFTREKIITMDTLLLPGIYLIQIKTPNSMETRQLLIR